MIVQSKSKTFEKNEVIYKEGSIDDSVYFI